MPCPSTCRRCPGKTTVDAASSSTIAGPGLEELLTDRGGVRLETSVPPGRVAQEQLASLVADAEAQLPPQLARAVRDADGDVEAALRAWEPGRLELGRTLLARSRAAGARLQSGRWQAGEQLAFGLYAVGDGFME